LMNEVIEIFRKKGAVVVDPAEIPSTVDQIRRNAFPPGTYAGTGNGKETMRIVHRC
jgi:hypothetical protein